MPPTPSFAEILKPGIGSAWKVLLGGAPTSWRRSWYCWTVMALLSRRRAKSLACWPALAMASCFIMAGPSCSLVRKPALMALTASSTSSLVATVVRSLADPSSDRKIVKSDRQLSTQGFPVFRLVDLRFHQPGVLTHQRQSP